MCHSAALFPFQGTPLLSSSFSDIHTTSAYLESLSVPYSLLPGILSVHTFHTPHTTLPPPLYTTPTLIGKPHLGCPFYSAPVSSIIGHALDFSSILFAVPFVAWPHALPFPLLATPFLLSKGDTLCTCVLPFHT